MPRILTGLLGALLLCLATAPSAADDQAEIEAILVALAEDEAHAFLRTLAPTPEDCASIFRRAADAELACAYAEAMYAGLEAVSEDSMKPVTESGDTLILRASPALIESGAAHPVFGPYSQLAVRLDPELTLYAFVFVDEEGAPRKSRSVLLRGADRWVFVPQLQRAFES